MFLDLLKTQLLLKGVITDEDWPAIRDNIVITYLKDGHYAEMRDMDLLRDRLEILNSIEPYIGEWFSKEYVQKHVFRMSDEEIESMKDSIDSEPPPPDIDTDDEGGDDDDKGPPKPPGDEEEPEEEEIQIDSIERR